MSAPPSARGVGLRNAYEGCSFVDELGSSAVGELVVSGTDGPRGAVFVERGRVCWAAARGLSRRLTELLGQRAALAPEAMETHFRFCRERRIPLGEHLVSEGILDARDLRAALLRHTVESLGHLCDEGARGTWCPREGSGYSPQFTFTTAEILASIGATSHEDVAADLRPLLGMCFGEGEWAAAFVRSASSAYPEPVAVHGPVPQGATMLVRFGKWAASALDVVAAFTEPTALFAVARASSKGATSLVAFRHGDAVVAGETGAHGPARILNRRAQQRRRGGRGNADL